MNKKLRKILTYLLLFVLAQLLIYFIGTGFIRQRYVSITDHSVSADGKEMTLKVSVPASIGYIRKVNARREGSVLYLDFYQAFGGLNGKIGAGSSYTVPLEDGVSVIAVYRGEEGYEYVLYRNAEGSWEKVE